MTREEILNELHAYLERLSQSTKEDWSIRRFFMWAGYYCAILVTREGETHRAVFFDEQWQKA